MTIQTSGDSETIKATLPPPRLQPLEAGLRLPPGTTYRERFLAEQLLGDEDVLVASATRTGVDVGSWVIRGRVWVFALRTELALLACGSCGLRWYARRIPYAELRRSQYNHVTGELALSPVESLPFRGLKLPALEGYQILAQVYRG